MLHQLDDDLKIEQQEFTDYVKEKGAMPSAENYKGEKIIFEPTGFATAAKITSEHVYDSVAKEYETTRSLVFPILFNGRFYKVSVAKSQQETEDLVQLIVWLTLAIVVLLLSALFTINRFVLYKLWHPFNITLKELNQFNVNASGALQLKNSEITEFKELNIAVTKMSNRVMADYENLKSFTENASHEIQTPLAIINSKIEILIQSENLSEAQMHEFQGIQDGVRRLSKLNKSLLLMTKIDNHQFEKVEPVDIGKIVTDLLTNFEELIATKDITLTIKLLEPCIIIMNETMAQVLLSNLITNSIRHNIKNGTILLNICAKRLVISNTGTELKTLPQELFKRFKKDSLESDSLGLGLALVKKIGGAQ